MRLAFELAERWRNPVVVFGDYYLAHTRPVRRRPAVRGSATPPEWALDGSTGGSGRAKLVSFLGSAKQRDDVGYDLAEHYPALCRGHGGDARPASSRWPKSTCRGRRRGRRRRLRDARRRYVRAAVRRAASRGRARRARSVRSPCSLSRPRRCRDAATGARVGRCLREQPGPDDRRRPAGVLDGAPGASSSVASASTAPASASRPISTSRSCGSGSRRHGSRP